MEPEKKKFIYSLIFPAFFILIIWIIKVSELVLETHFTGLGIYPRNIGNLHGIITAPLVHGDINHLYANTVPVLVLGVGLFYFYRPIGLKIFLLIYLISGLMLWIGGRPGYHIGASGLIYGMAAFMFFSGLIRRYVPLMAISLLVAFLYGSLIWGVLPLDMRTSWEGHLFGAVTGIVLSVVYRKYGPQRKKYDWEIEEELEEMGEGWDEYDWEIYYHFNKDKHDKKKSD